jgi:chemotaxis protein MotD
LPDADAKTEAGPKSAGRKEEALPAPVEARPLASGNSAGKDTSALPDIEVKVVRSETHLAPVSQPPAALQIADRIAQALASPGGADATAGPSPTGADKPAPTSTLKVLHIELQPADLGTVVVRLSLRNDALEIQLDVARANTAHLLQKDRDTLSGLLRSSGYQVDGLAVQVADSDRLSSMSGQQSGTSGSGSGQSSSQYQSGGAQPSGAQANGGGWSGSRSQSENPAQDQSAHRRQGARDADSAGDAGSRGVYV